MKNIKLRKLPVTDLSVRFAREIGPNHFVHYRVSHALTMFGVDPLLEVSTFLNATEGPCEVQLLPEMKYRAPNPGEIFASEDATAILDQDKALKATMEKHVNSTSVILQRTVVTQELTRMQKVSNAVARVWNSLARSINGPMFRVQMKVRGFDQQAYQAAAKVICGPDWWESEENSPKADERLIEEQRPIYDRYQLMMQNAIRLPLMTIHSEKSLHKIYPATYLTVTFEEGDERLATEIILNDLRTVQKNIIATFSMPRLVPLVDEIGNGKRKFALWTAVFLNNDSVAKSLRTNTPEGNVIYIPELDFRVRYEIEEFNMGGTTTDTNRAASVAAFENSKEHVNAVAKKAKEFIASPEYAVLKEEVGSKLMIENKNTIRSVRYTPEE